MTHTARVIYGIRESFTSWRLRLRYCVCAAGQPARGERGKRSTAEPPDQSGQARGGARTMRWLWAALLCVAVALSPPRFRPVLLTPRWHASASTTNGSGVLLLHVHRWLVELKENTAISAPTHHDCRFYRGRVVREAGSSAAVTECAGRLYGLLQVGGDEFLLQPANSVPYTHVLRRRAVAAADVALTEYAPVFNLTDDMVTDFDIDLTDYDDSTTDLFSHVRTRQSDQDTAYFHDISPVTRPLSAAHGLWLELAIVADHTMISFHGKERMNHYILALMNIVSAIFNDPSLNSNMTLVIKKLFHYEKDNTIKSGNVKKSLESVNKWNHRNLRKLQLESRWDAVVWLTRAELGGPSGLAPVGGVCSTTRSAAIDRDEGLTSAFVIAHELAHLLGLTHDDAESGCAGAARHASVMAPTVLATLHKYAWSRCSKDQFHKLSKTWTCMHYRNQDEGLQLGGAKELSNYMFSMDDQCRTQFGEGYETCKMPGLRSSCGRLWCATRALSSVCRSHAPPLDGTPCTPDRWCLDGECVPMPGHAVDTDAVDAEHLPTGAAPPEWGSWGGWSECSARCGYGLRTRSRRCRFGSESVCEGASAQAAVCWAGRECSGARDVRADICRKQSPDFIPHLHANDSKHCEIWCVERTGGDAFTFGALPDATPCSYGRHYDVCFQGTCVKGQCNASDPVCNWCPDDYCYNKTFVHVRRLRTDWSSMLTIPHNAHELSVHISTPTFINVAIREADKKKVKPTIFLSDHQRRFEIHEENIQYDPNVPQNLQVIEVDNNVIDAIEKEHYGYEGEVIIAGTVLKWRQTAKDISLSTESHLLSELTILGACDQPNASEDTITVVVSVNYSLPLTRTRPMEYRWRTQRDPCSVSCGGGQRLVRSLCPRGYHCPAPYYEACNQHQCEFEWSAGAWEECSTTCGDGGMQERQLYCVPQNISTSNPMDLVLWSVSPALCKEEPPTRQQSCNQSPCTFHWQELPWTPCSATCGRGITRRPLMCPAADETLCGPRPRERSRRCRLRRCPFACRSPDLQNCSLFTSDELGHKCALRPFRKLCCYTCKRIERAKADRRAGG